MNAWHHHWAWIKDHGYEIAALIFLALAIWGMIAGMALNGPAQ